VAKLHKRSDGVYTMGLVIVSPFKAASAPSNTTRKVLRPTSPRPRGLRVVSCSTPNDAYWTIQQSIEHDDPIIFCEPKSRYWERARSIWIIRPKDSSRLRYVARAAT